MPAPIVAAAGAMLAPYLVELAKNGLGMIVGAIQAKGKDVVEEKLGVKIPENPSAFTSELLAKLQMKQMEHEEFLVNAALKTKELDVDLEKHAGSQVSDRWKADMASTSWLSQNIRPLTLIFLLTTMIGVLIADGFGARFQSSTIQLLESCIQIVLAAYFIGRTVEKGINVVQEHRTKRHGNGS